MDVKYSIFSSNINTHWSKSTHELHVCIYGMQQHLYFDNAIEILLRTVQEDIMMGILPVLSAAHIPVCCMICVRAEQRSLRY